MSDVPTESPKIRIKEVDGGTDVDRANLLGCYFQSQGSPDIYQFFGVSDNHIPTIPEFLVDNTPGFQFIRAGMLWTVSEFDIDQINETADGRWSNPRNPLMGDDDGHFHAQSGPGTVEETASSATA